MKKVNHKSFALLLGFIFFFHSFECALRTNAQTNAGERKKPTTTTTPTAKKPATKKTTPAKKTTPRETFRPRNPNIELVKIPSGSFWMGSPDSEEDRGKDESPQHRVTIGYEFYMGKYEVTQAQWQAVMGNNPSYFKNCPQCPVEQVSWNDAQEFMKKLNALNDGFTYRLPSEAEWEYACRAGTTTAFAFGDSLSSSQANFNGNYPYGGAPKGEYKAKTTPVGSYQANGFGLYDMHGNVWEWVEDIYQNNYNGLATDSSANVSRGDSSARVLRGGCWINGGRDLRSAVRIRLSAGNRSYVSGFRVVASAKIQ